MGQVKPPTGARIIKRDQQDAVVQQIVRGILVESTGADLGLLAQSVRLKFGDYEGIADKLHQTWDRCRESPQQAINLLRLVIEVTKMDANRRQNAFAEVLQSYDREQLHQAAEVLLQVPGMSKYLQELKHRGEREMESETQDDERVFTPEWGIEPVTGSGGSEA